jgi:ribosomal-protein-alanine N-acetyltransferase
MLVTEIFSLSADPSLSPMLPLSSARLDFRSWSRNDTALAESLWCDPEVTRFFGGAMSREQAHDRLDIECERNRSLGMQYWPIFLRETGEFAGCAGLRPWSMDPQTIEAGVNLMRSAWGLRLGEEALLAVLAHGFDRLELPMIVAGHGVAHDNSRRLLERVGFSYTHNILWGPKEIEVCMWAITTQSWRDKTR